MSEVEKPARGSRKRIGPFSVVETLGEGGMGTVYRAKRKGEPDVAVKMIRPSLLDKDDIRARFEREAELLQSVDNPNVAKIAGFDASKKTAPWLATEFIEGPNLKDLVSTQGPLPEAEWRKLAEGVLNGIAAIHAKGIIHRDIKPANIMMSSTGPKIIDFGISKEEGQTALTQTQMFAGTVAYLAPERAETGQESQASDIYSAGLVLALAARGEHPYGDETTQSELAILMKMATEPPQLSGLSDAQASFLSALLERDVNRRPDAKKALAILRGEEPAPAPITKVGTRGVARKPSFSPMRRRGFIVSPSKSWLRGGLVALTPLIAAFLVAIVHHAEQGIDRVFASVVTAIGVLADSYRLSPSLVEWDWLLDSNSLLTTTLAIRPLGLLLLQAGLLFFFGRRYAPVMKGLPRSESIHHITALFAPSLFLVSVGSWLVTLIPSKLATTFEVSGLMPWDLVLPLGMFSLSFLAGLVAGGFAASNSVAAWWLVFLKRLVVFSSVGILAVLGGVTGYLIFSPDFAQSVSRAQPSPFHGFEFADYLVIGFWLLALVPVLIFQWLAAVVAQASAVALRTDDHVYFEMLALPADESLMSALVPQNGLFLAIFLIALGGIISAAAILASRDTKRSVSDLRSALQAFVLTFSAFILFFLLIRVSAPSNSQILGNTILHSSWESSLLMSAVFVVGILAAFGLMLVVGKTGFLAFIGRVFPRLKNKPKSAIVSTNVRRLRPLPETLFWSFVSLSFLAVIGAPLAFGLIERSLAQENTPLEAARDFMQSLQIEDAAGLRALFPSSDSGRWLPDSVLEGTQPELDTKTEFRITSDLGREWQEGELDAHGVLTWDVDGEPIQWETTFSSSISRLWGYARFPQYEVVAKPVSIEITVDEKAAAVSDARLTVNGEEISAGTFFAIPGHYEFSRDGILLLAPFSETVSTTATNHEISVESVLSLPGSADSALGDAINERRDSCGTISRPNCYDRDSIERNLKRISGSKPSSFFDSVSSGLKDGGIKCWDADDYLLSASEMVRTVKCEQAVTSQTTYYDSRRIADPVYSVRCAYRYWSYWFGWTCLRYETYQSGTTYRTVRGSELATVMYRSEIPFYINVAGSIDESGAFALGEVTID